MKELSITFWGSLIIANIYITSDGKYFAAAFLVLAIIEFVRCVRES